MLVIILIVIILSFLSFYTLNEYSKYHRKKDNDINMKILIKKIDGIASQNNVNVDNVSDDLGSEYIYGTQKDVYADESAIYKKVTVNGTNDYYYMPIYKVNNAR